MSELTQRHLPKLIGLVLTLAVPAAGAAQAAPQTALFTEDFNSKVRLIGKNSQAQTFLPVKHAHDLPGWTKQGADMPAHWVEQYPGNWVFMLVANKAGQNVFTQKKGIAANDKGHTYTVSFDAGPAVYAALSQATAARDEIAVELLRADGTVLKKHVVAPGKWQGKFVLENHTFAYQGDGSGPLRFRISPVYTSGIRFFGAIDHLQVFGSADEATAAIATRRKMDKEKHAKDTSPWKSAIRALWESEYSRIERGLRANRKVQPGSNPYVLDEQSLLLTTDKTPLDVQLRRTRALLAHLKKMPAKKIRGAPAPRTFEKTVNDIAAQARDVRKSGHPAQIRNLYMKLRAVTRQAALSNPLLAFNDLLFMGYMKPRGPYHMVDQYSGWNARRGGGIYILRSFKTKASIVNVLAKSVVANGRFKGKSLVGGAFLRPDLSFDAQRIAFAWNNIEDKCYHIFTVNVDGSKLTMLTDGIVNFNGQGLMDSSQNDFDPIWLPNGRIAFLSERRGGYLRCSAARPLMTFTLHSMKDDGSDLIPISYHETNEWNPSVDRDGRIVYTRWDYVDRDDCIAHHLWTCYPDGCNPRAPHGNYPLPLSYKDRKKPDGRRFRPNGEWNIRAIPNSNKYIATASGHHAHSFGELIMIDTSIPDDGMMSQVKGITTGRRIWPDAGGDYAAAWPLSEDYYLCTYRKNIILLDRFGNKELICPTSAMPTKVDRVMHPIPLEPRPAPPVVPTATYQGQRANVDAPAATISVMNVYEGDMPMPEGTRIKWLRVIQIIPQLNPVMNKPQMGYGSESNARMPLGIVPVETDGSVYFKAPVAKNLYFQLLDKRGLAVRSMRSATYVHPGESMSCVGCHEPRESAPKSRTGRPTAFRRAPSDLKPEVSDGAVPYNWYRLTKPVLDAKCLSCHTKKNKPPDMTYASLRKYAFYYPFRTTGYTNGEIVASGSRTVPGEFGAMASPLLKYLDKSHYDVSLTPKEFRRITLWLDCNANELGAYTKAAQQRRGQIVWPSIDVDPKNPLGLQKVARGR